MSSTTTETEKKISSNTLAVQRTKMANQRTYLAYMRTGFGIASLAGAFKKWWIGLFGILMIIGSCIQYLVVNHRLQQNEDPIVPEFDLLPVIYVLLGMGVLYVQYFKRR